MAGQWPKVVRDPIHDIIRFADNHIDRLLLALIDCSEFQRLRRIKQLGFSDTVFPGATHTRFAHSIGVMWNAKRILRRLEQLDESLVTEEHREVILVAALLHDIGHGPFSHAFEKVTGTRHERRTVEIILDPESEIHKKLSGPDSTLPHRVASLFAEGIDLVDNASLGTYTCPGYLRSVVSSQLDADRWDYLFRDSHFSGTEYGRFDVAWLIDHLQVDKDKDRVFLTRKARHAVEGYVFARYHMYQAVYFHKATRSSEVMLRLLFARYKALLDEKDSDSKRRRIVRDAPPVLMRAFSESKALSVRDYLTLDDHSVTQFLRAATEAKDATLAYLAQGLLNRRLYKGVDASDSGGGQIGDFVGAATRELHQKKAQLPVDPDFALQKDEPSDTPYKIYEPDSENPTTQIYIQLETNEIVELSTVSDQVDALKKKVTKLRYYFPPEVRSALDPIANTHLQRRAA